jgi:hypothetical protein
MAVSGATDKDQSQEAIKTQAEYLLDPLSPATWTHTAKVIAASKPELVAIQWWTTFWSLPYAMLTRLLKRRGIRVVYVIHNVLPHETKPWDRWLARLALSPAQAYIVHTEEENTPAKSAPCSYCPGHSSQFGECSPRIRQPKQRRAAS